MKNFVQAMNKHGKGFEYLREKFPKLSDAKLKEACVLDHKFVKSLVMICQNTCGQKLRNQNG
jgi:hypothetical protein